MMKETTDNSGAQWLRVLLNSREISLLILLAALVLITTALNPRFLSAQSIKDLLLNVSIIALLTEDASCDRTTPSPTTVGSPTP